MDNQEMLNKVSKPGDPDLGFDVDGITISSIIHLGDDIILTLKDGFGWWNNTDGTRFVADPGDPNSRVVDVEVTFGYHDAPELVAKIAQKLEEWRTTGALLHMVWAPGRMGSLIFDNKTWLPIPMREANWN
jgi:hypothetical protein